MNEKRFNMWNRQLLCYLSLIQYPIDILYSKAELFKLMKQAVDEAINECALELMCMHNLSFAEAQYIVASQLFSEYKGDR